MPIYDWENGTYHPIKNVYDWENKIYHPIKNVYDWENKVYHPIWSGERVLLNGAFDGENTGGWVGSDKPSASYQDAVKNQWGVVCQCRSTVNKTLWTANKINLSEYSEMRVDVGVRGGTAEPGNNAARGYGVIANPARSYTYSAPNNDTSVNWGTAYQWRKFMSHVTGTDGASMSEVSNGFRKTFVIDISRWTGWHHLGLIAGCGPANSIEVTFWSVTLS